MASDAIVGKQIVIHCSEGSYADTWATKNGFTVSYDPLLPQ